MDSRRVFNLALFTIFTTILWLAASIYTSLFRIPNTQIEDGLTAEIRTEDFDIELLQELSQRVKNY
ncbi:MAG: hypothetical protein QG570_587 [Patescibacteria group bacterium]|nr:hypothetical protein [Patescibacteria group bacterium]